MRWTGAKGTKTTKSAPAPSVNGFFAASQIFQTEPVTLTLRVFSVSTYLTRCRSNVLSGGQHNMNVKQVLMTVGLTVAALVVYDKFVKGKV